MQVSLWPKGLIGRITAVILVALVLEFIGSIHLHGQVDSYTTREDHARRVAEMLVVGERLLRDASPRDQAMILESLSTQHLTAELRAEPPRIAPQNGAKLDRLRAQIVNWEPSLKDNLLRLGAGAPQDHSNRKDLVGALRLDDGRWLHFRSRDIFGRWPLLYRTVATAAILAGGLLLAAAMLIHGLGAPLRALARAADGVGHGHPVTVTVDETGPRDLNKVARAFNAMQSRIGRLIADRTQALAAVGHDLRTPLTRMRLRAGLLRDEESRAAMEADISEMEAMLDSVLAYLKGDSDNETPRMVDVAVLVSTLVDANADLGREATYEGPDHLALTIRPLALKRAVGNLIENGLKYGDRVRVSVGAEGDQARIRVDDDGPGIPKHELENVVAPFFRLDEARRRDTGGLGLGLSIVANVVEREAGELRLSNLPEGGLRAEILLPQVERPAA
jgi:two-component system, OmpR family, osmolarity sensor histidine kinase EnvZ